MVSGAHEQYLIEVGKYVCRPSIVERPCSIHGGRGVEKIQETFRNHKV